MKIIKCEFSSLCFFAFFKFLFYRRCNFQSDFTVVVGARGNEQRTKYVVICFCLYSFLKLQLIEKTQRNFVIFCAAGCPSATKVLNCTPKCKQDADCSAIGGKCCPNLCNERSCIQRNQFDQSNGNSKGGDKYCKYKFSIVLKNGNLNFFKSIKKGYLKTLKNYHL